MSLCRREHREPGEMDRPTSHALPVPEMDGCIWHTDASCWQTV